MKSKEYALCKRVRCKTKSLQSEIKKIKAGRSRYLRRFTKQTLKVFADDDKLYYKKRISDDCWNIA